MQRRGQVLEVPRRCPLSVVRTGVRLVILAVLAACGSPRAPDMGGDDTGDAGDPAGDASSTTPDGDIPRVDAAIVPADAAGPDAFPSVLDLKINCRNDCVLIADPPSITVQAGTEFTVNWINTGDTECDVAKIDQFNQVPIIIGLEPGTSHHDNVREWCGPFTGTFNFRVSICRIHSFIPVDCDG